VPERAPRVDIGSLVPAELASELWTKLLNEGVRGQSFAQHDRGDFCEMSAVPTDHANEGADPQICYSGDVQRDHPRRLRHRYCS